MHHRNPIPGNWPVLPFNKKSPNLATKWLASLPADLPVLPDKRVFRFFPLRSTIRGTCLYCLYSGKRSRSGCDESAVWSVLNPGLGCIDPVIHVLSLSVLCILYLYTVLVLCILLIFQLAGTISISLTMPCGGNGPSGSLLASAVAAILFSVKYPIPSSSLHSLRFSVFQRSSCTVLCRESWLTRSDSHLHLLNTVPWSNSEK